MNYILFDDNHRNKLLPLVFTRPVADIRIGILTIREKWEHFLNAKTSSHTEAYLSKKFPIIVRADNFLINASVLPNPDLVEEIQALKPGEILSKNDYVVAARLSEKELENVTLTSGPDDIISEVDFIKVENNWDIFSNNSEVIKSDFNLLTKGKNSAPLSKTNFILGDVRDIFVEEGADVEFSFLNTTNGPIYIGKDATVMEGCKVRGPFALCEHSTLKMDAKIYEGTTVGPHCKVGGEVQNTVFFGYSNKGHDGYLGNSVIGEWCNFGADTNNSNLKNTYDIVKLWSYADRKFVNTGLQFCGLIMGDHSKTGINTMFNTGTVVGVSCNIYGAGYQRNFLPSFSWGGPHAMMAFNLKKSFDVAVAAMKRRGIDFDRTEEEIFTHIYNKEQKS